MTLTDFLLARIAEDEQRARDSYYEGQRWAPEEEAVVSLDRDLEPVMFLDRKRDAWFAAKWSPARVLAECKAKRGIVDGLTPHDGADGRYDFGVTEWDVMRCIALPYADHPDYREEWRP